jgi:putative membrane protein
MTDLILTILHHILAFGLVSLIVGEALLLRSGVDVARIARLDAAIGASAGLIVIVGILRVIFGLRGYEYYLGNHWFWGKMLVFIAIGLLSIIPTRYFLGWRRARRDNPAFMPPETEVAAALRIVRIESLLVILLIIFAATMARYG